MTNEKELLTHMREAIYSWYPFERDASIFFVKNENDLERADRKYDYVISIAAPEKTQHPVAMLREMKGLLKPDGHLLLGMNNRMGIKYFCGDRDPYTDRNFDGVEGYWRAYSKPEDKFVGRAYDEAEIREMLEAAGWKADQIMMWSVLSGLDDPFLIFAEDYVPNEELSVRVAPEYNYPDTVFLDEEKLYSQLIKNGLFYKMGNAYLIECGPADSLSDMVHVTSSLDRGRDRALYTVIHRDGTVEKKAAFPEGRKQLRSISDNLKRIEDRGIHVIKPELSSDGSIMRMPYCDAPVGTTYLRQLAVTGDRKGLLKAFDRLWKIILDSSEHLPSPDEEYLSRWKQWFLDGDNSRKEKDWDLNYSNGMLDGPILKKAYIDLIPLNSFYTGGDFCFFDQEFCVRDLPAKVIMWRTIDSVYSSGTEFEQIIPVAELRERYGLTKHQNTWAFFAWEFTRKLRNADTLTEYRRKHWKNYEVVNTNRQRMNFSSDEYKRLFIDVFDKCDSRKIILFGSGNFAKRFLEIYGDDHDIVRILDNRQEKWDSDLNGIPIRSPESIKEFSAGEYKVIVCIKNYLSVIRQLKDMGVYEFSIYDPAENYQRVIHHQPAQPQKEKKKYHVGYIAGVFDLFHIGHLNMFRRAKELCDYLIVGVVTDEGVKKFKRVEPFIPFEERIEMVRSCRYVDEAVNIPLMMGSTETAWKTLHFDVQFSGSDYINDPAWLSAKRFLEEHGAELVFFPYTKQTSSTKIKALINKELEKNE